MTLGWEVLVRSLAGLLLGHIHLPSPVSTKIRRGSFPNIFSRSLGGGRSTWEHHEALSCWDTFPWYLPLSQQGRSQAETNTWVTGKVERPSERILEELIFPGEEQGASYPDRPWCL